MWFLSLGTCSAYVAVTQSTWVRQPPTFTRNAVHRPQKKVPSRPSGWHFSAPCQLRENSSKPVARSMLAICIC